MKDVIEAVFSWACFAFIFFCALYAIDRVVRADDDRTKMEHLSTQALSRHCRDHGGLVKPGVSYGSTDYAKYGGCDLPGKVGGK